MREKYNITYDQQIEIGVEAVVENWKMPEPPPLPNCCK